MVEMAVTAVPRLRKLMDREHRKHEPGNRFEHAIFDYHRHVDELMIACSRTPTRTPQCSWSPTTAASVWTAAFASTSGCAGPPRDARSPTPRCLCARQDQLAPDDGLGRGRYCSRIFLNVQGREPEGTVPAADYERVRDDLARRIAAIPDENGEPLGTRVHVPDEIYPEVNGGSRPT